MARCALPFRSGLKRNFEKRAFPGPNMTGSHGFCFSLRFYSIQFEKSLLKPTRFALLSPRVSPPPKVSCFTVLFACVRQKRLELPIKSQHFASENVFFAFSLRFCSGSKKHYKHRVKVSEMLPKPHFLHTVSAQSRYFQSAFEKTIFVRDQMQKFTNLPLFQLF